MPINNHLRNIKMHSSSFAAIVSLVFTKKHLAFKWVKSHHKKIHTSEYEHSCFASN